MNMAVTAPVAMPKARWTMIALCLLANVVNYVDRANLAIAAPAIQQEFGFDSATLGLLLGAFFWSYAVMQLPFGWFADKVGPRISMTVAVVWWSAFTALTGAARGAASLFGLRLMLGGGVILVSAARARARELHL
jgi:sugar phosphate permease